MVIFPALAAKGRRVAVVKEMVVVLLVAFVVTLSLIDRSIITPVTTLTRAGTITPALTASVAVFTVKPVADTAVAAPVVSSPAAKVILCAPAAKSAVAVSQTMVRTAAVNVQLVSVAVPPVAGTRTPAGAAFALK